MKRKAALEFIIELEKKFKGPLQGSEEWYKIREKTTDNPRGRIGGSEIASLIGYNPYTSAKELVKQKRGIKPKRKFDDKIYCWFGIVFEDISVSIFEKIYNTQVTCKDICIVKAANIKNFMFSPDGVCILPCIDDNISLDTTLEIDTYKPVLIEIKCPLTRQLAVGAETIPSHYTPQIQGGLMSFEDVTDAVFIDNCFRICNHQHLIDDTSFNKILHKNDINPPSVNCIYKGIIYIYGINPITTRGTRFTKIHNGIIDFGSCSYKTITTILRSIRENKLTIEYEIIDKEKEVNIEDYLSTKNNKPLGVICWKLFDITVSIVRHNEIIKQKIIESMNRFNEGEYDSDSFDEVKMMPYRHQDVTADDLSLS